MSLSRGPSATTSSSRRRRCARAAPMSAGSTPATPPADPGRRVAPCKATMMLFAAGSGRPRRRPAASRGRRRGLPVRAARGLRSRRVPARMWRKLLCSGRVPARMWRVLLCSARGPTRVMRRPWGRYGRRRRTGSRRRCVPVATLVGYLGREVLTPAGGTYSECGFGSDSVRVSSACAEPLNRLRCQVVPLPRARPHIHTHTRAQTHAPHSRSTLAHVRRRCGTRRIRACPLSTACAAPLRRSGSALAGCVCPSGHPAAALHPTDWPTLPTLRCLRPGGRPGRACP